MVAIRFFIRCICSLPMHIVLRKSPAIIQFDFHFWLRLTYLSYEPISYNCRIWFGFMKGKWSFFEVALYPSYFAIPLSLASQKRNFEEMNCRSVLINFNVICQLKKIKLNNKKWMRAYDVGTKTQRTSFVDPSWFKSAGNLTSVIKWHNMCLKKNSE